MSFDWQTCKLIGITKPNSEAILQYYEPGKTKELEAKDLIGYCARVSNPKNQENFTTSDKLLKYCMDNEHWSVFETVSITIEICTTRDIGRQILRHRSFSFQEFSQRYAEKGEAFPSDDYRECRLQDNKNRQNSLDTADEAIKLNWLAAQVKVEQIALEQYNWAIKAGIAKEVARCILPEGLTMSRMYMAGTLRSWIHFCLLRMGNGTQKEHQDIAKKCWNIIINEFDFLHNV